MASFEAQPHEHAKMEEIAKRGGSIAHGPRTPPLMDKLLGQVLKEQARRSPSSLMVVSHHQKKSLSYGEADTRSDQLARGLVEMGAKKGDRIAIMAGNEIEYVEVFFACAKIGVFSTLANYAYSESELHAVLSSCGASMLVIVPGFDRYDYTSWFPRLKRGIRSLAHVIVLHGDDRFSRHAHHYEDVVSLGAKSSVDLNELAQRMKPREIINLQFTSGSTGVPKSSALTHRGLHNAGRFLGAAMLLTPGDRICSPVPLFHSFGLIVGLATIAAHGCSMILPEKAFNVEATLECISVYKCTGIYGVTTMFISEMEHPTFKSCNLKSLRFALLAGSAVPDPLMKRVRTEFGISQTHTNWGLTEACSIVAMTKPTDPVEKCTTSGKLFAHMSIKIVDPATNRAVPRGQRGEMVLRGYGIQACYYSNEPKTREAHKVSPEDGLEWFHTGDEGLLDKDDYVVMTGRIKDLIIRGGENITPLEIEECLANHPAVVQSAVIGVPDKRYGEAICAFIEFHPGAQPSDEDLKNWVRHSLARFKTPKYIIRLGDQPEFEAWPKTGSGKLRKVDLRIAAKAILPVDKEGDVISSPARL